MNEENQDLYLGAVFDAMHALGQKTQDFYLDIKPMVGYSKLVSGPAFTTLGRTVEKYEDYEKVDQSKYLIFNRSNFTNKPIVLLQANDDYCAHFGEITALIYKKMGASAFITDGNCRDIEIIQKYEFPTFCQKVNPIDAVNHWSLIDYNIPISIKNILIEPGDWIYANKEGVIRVKKVDILNFKLELTNILNKENKIRIFINESLDSNNFPTLVKEFSKNHGRW